MTKTFGFLSSFLVLTNLYGQDSSSLYQLKVKYNKKNVSKRIVPESDSINIVFLYGYNGDIIRFKTQDEEVVSDTLRADDLYGIGGSLKIAKSFLKNSLKVYFNEQYVGELKVDKHYSLVHLEYNKDSRVFTWRYHKYRFAFI